MCLFIAWRAFLIAFHANIFNFDPTTPRRYAIDTEASTQPDWIVNFMMRHCASMQCVELMNVGMMPYYFWQVAVDPFLSHTALMLFTTVTFKCAYAAKKLSFLNVVQLLKCRPASEMSSLLRNVISHARTIKFLEKYL